MNAGPERVRVFDVEMTEPIEDVECAAGYREARALVRSHGTPVAFVRVAVRDGVCAAADIRAAIAKQVSGSAEAAASAARTVERWPSLTVAVCTRGRPDELAECLAHLVEVDYPEAELLVIDNAPADDANAEVCRAWPRVRRIVEPRPGLNWARNRAVIEASGEILAFTDDDARVDRAWARELARVFVEDASVGAVAGLGVPLELETPAQLLFEQLGGASGGFTPIRMRGGADWGVRGMWHYAEVAAHGSGANMAFRRAVFERTGLFDPALDVGTLTNGAGDIEMLFRVLAHGYAMAYEPRAIVRHRHRRDLAKLERQISGWGSGFTAFLTRSALAFPRAWWVLGLFGARHLGLLTARVVRPGDIPRRLVITELKGALAGPLNYLRARARARRIERAFGPQRSAA